VPANLDPPRDLSHLKYFIVQYSRETEEYTLAEPQMAQTYRLGHARKAFAHFCRMGMEYLGGRAMDSALAFGASQALVKENRAFGLDLCKVDLHAGILRKVDIDEDRRLIDDDENPDACFISGVIKPAPMGRHLK
jgi:hypothetical protein